MFSEPIPHIKNGVGLLSGNRQSVLVLASKKFLTFGGVIDEGIEVQDQLTSESSSELETRSEVTSRRSSWKLRVRTQRLSRAGSSSSPVLAKVNRRSMLGVLDYRCEYIRWSMMVFRPFLVNSERHFFFFCCAVHPWLALRACKYCLL